ncbi:MAG: hypothetical protein ABSF35_10175 [Polyangia bacterium]
MTSRATHGSDFLRTLLMPALAVGLVVGCAPAKGGGGGGTTGQSGGNSSSPGSTSNPSGGNTGSSSSTFNPSGGNSSSSSSTSNPSGGNTSSSSSTSNPSGGNTSSSSRTSGGTTSSSGATTSSSGGTTSSSGGTTSSSGGTTSGSSGGSNSGGSKSGGSSGGAGGSSAGGSGGSRSGGSGGSSTGGSTGTGGATGGGGCANTNTSVINEDSSGYVCNNTWGIQGAWYCYTDGSDSSTSCKGTDGKGNDAIPWNASSSAMCLSGTMGTGTGSYAGIGFKVNSGPPGSTATPGTWNASKIVGFAITLESGASGKGSGGMILNLEYPTSTDLDSQTKDAPGITVPGVPTSGTITYNALFSDGVLANDKLQTHPVDPANLTDVKIAFFPDSISHTYDFCIKSVVPLTTAPNPVVATGAYGPTWNNQLPQAVNGINGYAVQSAPFPTNGNPMTMQVSATSDGVGFTYTTGGSFQAQNNGPGSFPAIISGWGPGHDGIQFYGPYQGGKQISQLTSVKSTWSFTMGSTGDAVYDVWFSNSSAKPPVPGIELMVWIGNTGKNPLGSVATPGTAVSGRIPYVGTNGTGESVVSYWVTSPGTTSVSDFDLLPYFQDAASHGYAGLKTSSYLLGVQTGFEVYSGNWTTTDYNISIQ